jgi:dTMP kinase
VNGQAGALVSIDGPGGSGKSTVAAITAGMLIGRGLAVHETTEPSRTPLGKLIRAGTDEYRGMALACLVAGDRHHHLAAEIRPALAAGQVVLCDRYLPSSLVLQRMDGIGWNVIRQLNDGADQPALAVILNAAPDVIAARLNARGGHSRFERQPGSSHTESRLYRDTAERLAREGWPVRVVDVTTRTAREAAMIVSERILALRPAQPPEQP